MKSLSGHYTKRVEEFNYLVSYLGSIEHELTVRIGSAWEDLYRPNRIWINLNSK